ncbi:MAG: AraC family transcriptional regulator [Planctomycetes bacterium]|nr:AraC family transcriptional regulator [Planctomycetota bacterium]
MSAPRAEEIRPDAGTAALLRVDWYKYCERGREYHTPGHTHRYHQWYHLIRGEVRVRAGAIMLDLKAGQSVLFSPGADREIWAGRRPPAYFAAVFEPLARLDLAPVLDRVLEITPDLEPDMRAMIEAARRPRRDDDLLVQALLVRTMIAFKRRAEEEAEKRTSAPAPSALNRNYQRAMVERVELILRQHYHEPLTREDLAEAVHLSPGHLARLYRAATGQTLVDRITQLRLEAAKALLLNSTHSITQIAMEVGYASFSHFSKIFKDLERMSPGDYRRSAGLTWQKTAQLGDAQESS